MSERRWRAAVVAGAVGAAAGAWVGWIEPRRLATVRTTLHLPGWPHALDGLRVGLLSDLHAGAPHATLQAIRRAVDALNAERPDLVLLLGDYIDSHPVWGGRIAPEGIARELARLTAPRGVTAVLGNHDWKQTGDRMWRALVAEGIEVLENQATDKRGFHVAGLADLRLRRPDLPTALAHVPQASPVLLLAHDPDVFPYVPRRIALTVSGHTHGGQVAIPFVRRPAIPSRHGERYARGHVTEDGRHLYVTSGLGTSGLPFRALAPPEVVVLELRPADAPARGSAA
jgi:predicted MPP superfamily phosphohydrolase